MKTAKPTPIEIILTETKEMRELMLFVDEMYKTPLVIHANLITCPAPNFSIKFFFQFKKFNTLRHELYKNVDNKYIFCKAKLFFEYREVGIEIIRIKE